jgi:ketosteroid isomerase-like protein
MHAIRRTRFAIAAVAALALSTAAAQEHAHGAHASEGAPKMAEAGHGDEHGHAHGTDPIPGSSKDFVDAYTRGDLDAIVARHPEDGEILPPNLPRQRGHAAIRAFYGAMIAMKLSVQTTETAQGFGGAMGYKTGSYEVRMADGSVADRGKWLEVWELRGKTWQLVSDMWNSDLPPPAAAPSPAAPAAG